MAQEKSSLALSSDETLDLASIATLHHGTVNGAVFALAMPKNQAWNSCLLLHAHGFRAPETPLHAEVDDPFWWRLVANGWAVGVTSYRRSGKMVGDAIKDLNNLRNYVCNEFGAPFWVFVDGRSMGGAVRILTVQTTRLKIATRIAELPNAKTLYAGVMAIGAALLVQDDDPRYKLTYRPTLPIVYLTNTSEIGPIEDYIAKVKAENERDAKYGGNGDEVRIPALHLVYREGHNWTNPRERWAAFSLLLDWAFSGTMVTQYLTDGTKPGKAIPGTASIVVNSDKSKTLTGSIIRCHSTPRAVTNFTVLDLADALIKVMSKFTLVNQEGKEIEATFGAYPFVGIDDSATVAAEDPEGYILFFDVAEFRNKESKNIPTMGFKVGDKVTIKGPCPVLKPQPKRFNTQLKSQTSVLVAGAQ